MISNQEEDEFVAVRVQDPRIQNEGSWNSYVDYKIFLHTNSKAFTAKTSCVRRRYSEFAWLRKKLQKNAGLVPVPDLPGKSFFSFSNEDFLEGRRKGLQVFLDKVVHMTVCLSDSQLHLFLQTQLPVGHIQDCVQGHTPYTVTDAILTYASSNRGLAQAQEEDAIKEPSLTVSYESMESPAPHQPATQTADTCSPELLSCTADPLEGLLESKDTAELHLKDKPSIKVLQKNNHLEAVVEDCNPAEASFFVGDSPPDQSQARSCVIQTPVEVHLPRGSGFEEERCEALQTEEKTLSCPDAAEQEQLESVGDLEPEECENPGAVLDLKDHDADSQEVALGVCSEVPVLENHAFSEDNSDESDVGTKEVAADVTSQEEFQSSDEQKQAEDKNRDTQELQEVTPLDVEIKEAKLGEENGNKDAGKTGQANLEQESDLVGTKDESDKESHMMQFSNGSIQTGDGPQEPSEEDDGSEELVLANPVSSEDVSFENVNGTESQVFDVQCQEEGKSSGSQGGLQAQEQQDAPTEEKSNEDGDAEQTDQETDGQRAGLVGTKDESDEESHSLPCLTEEVEDGPQEGSCSEKLLQENHVISEEDVEFAGTTNVQVDVTNHEGSLSSDGQEAPEKDKRQEATPHVSENHKDTPEEDTDDEQMDRGKVGLEADFVGTKGESDEDSQSLRSSNGSIVKVSDEESGCDEAQEENGFIKSLREDGTDWSEEEPSSGHILDLHLNGGPVEKDEELQYTADMSDFRSAVTGDQTENSDFSVIETSCSPVLSDNKCAEQEDVDASEEAHEVEVHQISS